MMQQAIFRPQPAFLQPQPMVRNHMARADITPSPSAPTQFGQLQGSSGPRQPSLEEVLSLSRPSQSHRAGNNMPLPSFMQPQNTTDPTQFGGEKATDLGSFKSGSGIALGGQLNQTIQPPTQVRPAPEQELRDQRGAQIQEMQSMMREMMQMISALSNRGGFGGGYGGGFGGGYSPRQQMMFGGIGSIPMSRGMFY